MINLISEILDERYPNSAINLSFDLLLFNVKFEKYFYRNLFFPFLPGLFFLFIFLMFSKNNCKLSMNWNKKIYIKITFGCDLRDFLVRVYSGAQ